jgi:putative sigma-54 modulation protein
MQIEFTGRNFEVTKALKEHIREKLGHAARVLEDDLVDAHVILTVEKYRHIAEIVVKRRRGRLVGKATSPDMYQSIQKAIERIESQLFRKHEKLVGRKRRGTAAKASAVEEPGDVPMILPGMREEPAAQVIDETLDRVKPIGVEEAILMLEEARRPFVIFRNAPSGRVAVVYRRADGNFGLIEPRA